MPKATRPFPKRSPLCSTQSVSTTARSSRGWPRNHAAAETQARAEGIRREMFESGLPAGVVVQGVPELEADVHDLSSLARLAVDHLRRRARFRERVALRSETIDQSPGVAARAPRSPLGRHRVAAAASPRGEEIGATIGEPLVRLERFARLAARIEDGRAGGV